jgi:hypothetical protein
MSGQMRIKTDYDKAIHETGHCVVAYVLGGSRLADEAMLSIVNDLENDRGGVALFHRKHEHGIAGVVGFGGYVAENIQSKQQVDIGGKDIEDILSDCSEIWGRARLPGECEDCDEDACTTHINRFANSLYVLTQEDYDADQEEKAVLADHLLLIGALCARSSKNITLKPSSPFVRKCDFSVLARLADTARDVLMKHWAVVLELAEWLDREKEIPNREVQAFLIRKLDLACRPLP